MDWNKIVNAIQDSIVTLREEYKIENAIIRDDVFEILESRCTVLYYPLEKEQNCGFHTKKFVSDELKDFVYINTAMPLETQVFTAAHELGHIWEVAKKVRQSLDCSEAFDQKMEEGITNRFAAELLMPPNVFRSRVRKNMIGIGISPDTDKVTLEEFVKLSAMQMNDFLVPYVAVRKRMHETGFISDETKDDLKRMDDSLADKAMICAKDMPSRLGYKTMKKTIPGLRALLEKATTIPGVDEILMARIRKNFENELSMFDFANQMIGDVHIMLMAFFTEIPVVLSDDSDLRALKEIADSRFNRSNYQLAIYNCADILKKVAPLPRDELDSVGIDKKMLLDFAKAIGGNEYKKLAKEAWNEAHES